MCAHGKSKAQTYEQLISRCYVSGLVQNAELGTDQRKFGELSYIFLIVLPLFFDIAYFFMVNFTTHSQQLFFRDPRV